MSHTEDDREMKVNSVVDFPSSKSIERQASEWLAKLDAEAPSREDLKAFEQWINKDAAHRQAFESQITFWDDQNILTQVVFPREETVQQRTVKNRSSFIWSRERLAVSGFAVLMLIISVVLLAPQFLTPSPVIYTTNIGEQKTIELPDHTTIFLNTNSQLKIDYDKLLKVK